MATVALFSALTFGCSVDGAVRFGPGSGRCVELRVYPANVACAEIDPADPPPGELRREVACDEAQFGDLTLPSEELTLVLIGRSDPDGCAVLGSNCARATPGQDLDLAVAGATTCAASCVDPLCRQDGGTMDAGPTDAGPRDAGPPDAGRDAGTADAGPPPDQCCEGLSDPVDAGVDGGTRVPTTADCDGDGLSNELESPGGGFPDTDGDGVWNGCDTDSDDDGIDDDLEDNVEPSFCDTRPGCTAADVDGDGTPNWLDTDTDNDGAYDGEECLGTCRSYLDSRAIVCGGALVTTDYCGHCLARTCARETSCVDDALPRYCAPGGAERLTIQVGDGPEVTGEDDSGEIVLLPLHGASEPIRFTSLSWLPGGRTMLTIPETGVLFDRFDVDDADCAPVEFADAPECIAIYRVQLVRDDGACTELPGVVVFSTYRIDVGNPTSPHALDDTTGGAALRVVQRGWQYYSPGTGGPWEPSGDSLFEIAVPSDASGCDPAFAFP
ncbi:MAG: hypothetical protein AB8I08_33905 [Sandaracinaceae bacterium]